MSRCFTVITIYLYFIAAMVQTSGFTPTSITQNHLSTSNTRLSVFGSPRATKNSPLLDEALAAYPFKFKSDAEKKERSQTFNEIARLYGDDATLEMVKILPMTLQFKRENFADCLDLCEEQFGLEKAQAMVLRNPGLLGVRPEQTDSAESAMFFSYVVALTRPLPKIIGAGGLLAILTAGLR